MATSLTNTQPRIEGSTTGTPSQNRETIGRLLIQCRDRPGIVSAVSGLLAEFGANIISLDQHSTDPSGGEFFQRTEFHLDHLSARRADLEAEIQAESGTSTTPNGHS